MSESDFSVALQERDGKWVRLGDQATGGFGVVMDSLRFTGDLREYGCLEASWIMRMNPKWPRNIIEHFTPAVIYRGAEPVWSGRIIAAPTNYGEDTFVTVQCQGWGQHTKDDCTDREWVIDDLSRWKDTKSHPSVTVANYHGFAPQIGDGTIILPCPRASTIENLKAVSATLDLGPNQRATRAVATFKSVVAPGTVSFHVYLRINDSPNFVGGGSYGQSITDNPPTTDTTVAVTGSPGGRYVHIAWYYDGATTTVGGDHSIIVSSLKVFTDTADESGNASILKASTIISEALAACCPMISTDTSKITTTSTNIPNFPGSPGYRYANELIDQANSIHGYITRLSPDPVPVFEFSAQPTDYSFVLGADEYQLEEPAAQDGRAVYNRVISEYEDATGIKAYSEVVDTNYSGSNVTQFANPGFEVNTSNWTAVLGTITRDTVVFDVGVASLRVTDVAGAFTTRSDLIQLVPRDTYVMTFRYRRAVTHSAGTFTLLDSSGQTLSYRGMSNLFTVTDINNSALGSFATFTFQFTAPDDGQVRFDYSGTTSPINQIAGYLDNFQIFQRRNNAVSRRNFTRAALRPMDVKSNSTIAGAFAQLELDNSQYPPFKGTLSVQGYIRNKGGSKTHVSKLPSRVGDAVLIEDLMDPNSGAIGRRGIIQSAEYNAVTDTCTFSIDDPTGFIEVLRNRLRSLGG